MERSDRFTTAKWSVVLRARDRVDPHSREALASLCEAYWYPPYVFVRRRGIDRSEALDLTQGFFAELLEKDFLDAVRPERGKFRSFLLAALKHLSLPETRSGRLRSAAEVSNRRRGLEVAVISGSGRSTSAGGNDCVEAGGHTVAG